MVKAVLPISFVLFAVSPRVYAIAVHFVIWILSFVLSAVLPGEYTLSIHHIVFPLAFVFWAIFPNKYTEAISFSLGIHAFVFASISHLFDTHTFLDVVKPLTLDYGSIHCLEAAEAICLVSSPLAYINTAIRLYHSTTTMRPTIDPFSFIPGAISPNLHARPMPHKILLFLNLFLPRHFH